MEEASIAAVAAAGDAVATVRFVAPPLLKEGFLTGAEFRSSFKLLIVFELSLFKKLEMIPLFQFGQILKVKVIIHVKIYDFRLHT